MKKMIVTALAIAMVAVAKAAVVVWGSSGAGIELPDGSIADSQVTMYLYEISATDYAGFTGTASEISTAVYNTYGTTGTSALDDWGITQIQDSRTFSSGDTAYAAVVFTYDDGTDVWYKGNVASYTFTSSADFEISDLDVNLGGSVGTASNTIGWTAVPEPTSGLLLLLGMAGLALKRKRA